MRRLLLVFLMLLMPLQSVWSAAASVCAHETAPVGQRHFGHHDPHHADAKQLADAQSGDAERGDTERANALNADHHHVLSATPVPSMPSIKTPAVGEPRARAAPADRPASALVASLERPPKAPADSLRQSF